MVSLWPWGSGSSDSAQPKPAQPSSTTPATILTNITGTPKSKDPNGSSPWSSSTSESGLSGPLPVDLPPLDVLIAQSDAKLSAWSSSPTILLGVFFATGLGFFWGRYARRMRTTEWITPDWLNGKRWVRGKVTSVGDGDNFRVFHTPPFGGYHWPFKLRSVPSARKELTSETLHVRLAGVDAPESAYFGRPEQPGAATAKAWLTDQILGRKVYVRLIRKDQYQRVVAHVHRPWRFFPGLLYKGPSVSEMMLKHGHACVYEQAGAEYGASGKEGYLALEEAAKKKRIGIWAAEQGESPAEYKKRYAAQSADKMSKT
ncbi:mitochondrial protein [Coprinopsis sp. MPI-PUGE-AT-0042]|nr:mitochondrial protein [Coprinopsis sp. MPI-PUGE-AT-0042]